MLRLQRTTASSLRQIRHQRRRAEGACARLLDRIACQYTSVTCLYRPARRSCMASSSVTTARMTTRLYHRIRPFGVVAVNRETTSTPCGATLGAKENVRLANPGQVPRRPSTSDARGTIKSTCAGKCQAFCVITVRQVNGDGHLLLSVSTKSFFMARR